MYVCCGSDDEMKNALFGILSFSVCDCDDNVVKCDLERAIVMLRSQRIYFPIRKNKWNLAEKLLQQKIHSIGSNHIILCAESVVPFQIQCRTIFSRSLFQFIVEAEV